MRVTYFVALPFGLTRKGRFLPGEAWPAEGEDHAERLAAGLMRRDGVVGVIVFSRTGDPETGAWDDAKIISECGEVPAQQEEAA